MPDDQRVVITGIGLTSPNGHNLEMFRASLLAGQSGVRKYNIRYVGDTLAGVCEFEATKYQSRRDMRRGTRAGTVGIWAASEAVQRSGLDWANTDKSRVGIYIGVTEHGNVETENEIYNIKQFDYDTTYWSHHHNPRTVANNPAGEIALNMGITGPHYTIGAACAAGNAGKRSRHCTCPSKRSTCPRETATGVGASFRGRASHAGARYSAAAWAPLQGLGACAPWRYLTLVQC
jgi:3-oxoacyl-[acyl-carrier-protein] synthase II